MAKDGGGFDSAPPPVGGLGNFKGVMLCNRPTDNSASGTGGGDGPLPFKSMVAGGHGDQLGLTPCRNFEPSVKKRGPSAALRRHVQWLKELQGQMKNERDQVDAEEADIAVREERMKATFHEHREGVREMLRERDEAQGKEIDAEKLKKRAIREAAKAEKLAKKNGGTAPPAKPKWAMTEGEKDDFEEGEADELINFAENLDYDKFIGDMEFRHGLDALKDRAGKVKREQEAFKDALIRDFNTLRDSEDYEGSTEAGDLEDGLDGRSLLGDQALGSEYSTGSRASKGVERYGERDLDWDGSTNCGDESRVDPEVRSMADQVLESHTQMRAVHSKGSVQKMIEKARDKEPPPPKNLHELMLKEAPHPIPVITASADTQARLHKPPDPSLLPYLYRSPAI